MRHTGDVCYQCNKVQRRRAVKILKKLQTLDLYDTIMKHYGLLFGTGSGKI